MSTRKLLVLTGIFLALLAFVVLFERHQPTSEEATKAGKRLLDFKARDVVSLLVERPDLPSLEVKKAAGRWSLVGSSAGPADAATVDGLLSDLGRLELVGEVQTSYDPKEYGLDHSKAKVTIVLSDGSRKTVQFGREIPGTDATAAAEGKRLAAVKFAPLAALGKPPDEFRSRALVEIPASELTRITIAKGPNQVVLAREGGTEKTPGEWRVTEPVKDLASQAFVEQLLSDVTGARISEFPPALQADLAKIGLLPPNAVITLQKGAEVASTVAFGAGKADAAGKIYAKRGDLVVVIDDRVQEAFSKELTAFRETKLLPVDSWAVIRVSFEADGTRTGAEKLEGDWRSGGRTIAPALAEDLAERVSRAEARAFVGKKDYASKGIAVATPKGKARAPLATLEVTKEGETAPHVVVFYPAAPLAGAPVVAAEVSGRSDALLVEKAVLDDLKGLATKLHAAAEGTPAAPGTGKKAATPTAPAAPPKS